MKNFLTVLICALMLAGAAHAQKKGSPGRKPTEKEMNTMIAEATPPALPQAPKGDRQRSDVQIANLKGKVKSVTLREVDLSGEGFSQIYTREETFNEQGDLVRAVDYDDDRPRAVTVYGYLNGARVSRSGGVRYPAGANSSSTPATLITVAGDPGADADFDMRYLHKHDADGRLIEKTHFGGGGQVMMRVTYTYESTGRRLLKHFGAGPVEWAQTTEVLDPAGNVTEEWLYDEDKKVSEIRTSTYELDKQGNWTVQKTFEKQTVNGKTVLKPVSVAKRTIVYYP